LCSQHQFWRLPTKLLNERRDVCFWPKADIGRAVIEAKFTRHQPQD
jgi:hypothetical protein